MQRGTLRRRGSTPAAPFPEARFCNVRVKCLPRRGTHVHIVQEPRRPGHDSDFRRHRQGQGRSAMFRIRWSYVIPYEDGLCRKSSSGRRRAGRVDPCVSPEWSDERGGGVESTYSWIGPQ